MSTRTLNFFTGLFTFSFGKWLGLLDLAARLSREEFLDLLSSAIEISKMISTSRRRKRRRRRRSELTDPLPVLH